MVMHVVVVFVSPPLFLVRSLDPVMAVALADLKLALLAVEHVLVPVDDLETAAPAAVEREVGNVHNVAPLVDENAGAVEDIADADLELENAVYGVNENDVLPVQGSDINR